MKGKLQNEAKSTVLSKQKSIAASKGSSKPIPIDSQLATGSIPPEFCNSPDEHATFFFFKNYVLEDNSNFQYLFDTYEKESVRPALTDSITALGMAGLASFYKAPGIMTCAQQKYNSALRRLSSSLADTKEAKADQTLITVIMLSLYEVSQQCSSSQH